MIPAFGNGIASFQAHPVQRSFCDTRYHCYHTYPIIPASRVALQNKRGLHSQSLNVRYDKLGNPRTGILLGKMLGLILRFLFGWSVQNLKVDVKAKSNRAVLFGRVDNIAVQCGEVNSGLLHFRRATITAKDSRIGSPLFFLFASLLAPLLLPLGWLWFFAFAACAYFSPRYISLQYDVAVSSADINTGPMARTILSAALSTIMNNSLVGAAFAAVTAASMPADQPGQPPAEPPIFELATAELEGGQVILGASTRLPSNSVFSFKLRTVLPPPPFARRARVCCPPLSLR
jgi:hypothetical protein